MGLSPSSMCRRLCCHRAGIVTLVAMVFPLLMRRRLCSLSIFAVVAITLLPSLQWRCCHHQAGVVALVMMVSSPSSMRRHLCHCHDGIIALFVLAPLPTLHGCCRPLLRRHWCPYRAYLFALMLHECCHLRCTSIVAPIELA
jgi:hypothetical protein